jgi:hypothetical protein
MRKLITTVCLFSSFSVFACDKPINPQKIILFVDTNNSEPEIQTAKKAACARGEKLMVVPQNYLEYGKYTKAVQAAEKAYMSCVTRGANCQAEEKKSSDAYQEMYKFIYSQPTIANGVEATMKEIQAQGAKLKNVTISGHDGGGHFGGYKGGISRRDLDNIMANFQDINEVGSVMLLGCYTGVQHEISAWRGIFPDARLIGGYDGSAPLSDKPAGHQYFEDLMVKEAQLTRQADQSRINSYVANNIRAVSLLNAAIYVNPVCENPEEAVGYYFASGQRAKRFQPVQTTECDRMRPQIRQMSERFRLYNDGVIEPPVDPSTGELRELYSQARAIEHCIFNDDSGMNVSQLFNLRFYDGVKKSFANYFKDDLAEVEEILKTVTPESLKENFERVHANSHEEWIASERLALKEFTEGNKLKDLWIPNAKNLSQKSRKETMQNLHLLDKLLSTNAFTSKQGAALNWLRNTSSQHLQYFENPFSWHEYNPHVPVEAPQYSERLSDYIRYSQDKAE